MDVDGTWVARVSRYTGVLVGLHRIEPRLALVNRLVRHLTMSGQIRLLLLRVLARRVIGGVRGLRRGPAAVLKK